MTKRFLILGTANDVLPVFLRIIRCTSLNGRFELKNVVNAMSAKFS